MNSRFKERRIEWHKFLMEYFQDSEYTISWNHSGFPYILKFFNISGSGIDFTDRWGFLTLHFVDKYEKEKFLKQAGINILIEKFQDSVISERITKNYSQEKFPCRIYPRSSVYTIAFYDSETVNQAAVKGNMKISELIEYRKSILETILEVIQKYNCVDRA